MVAIMALVVGACGSPKKWPKFRTRACLIFEVIFDEIPKVTIQAQIYTFVILKNVGRVTMPDCMAK